ncbi:hypothetical protein ALO42_102415 [Pseudomonas syringae pv. atrofaciens]|uniref:Uncharacterized protein n=3 Tax=Pseudomonas syringae group TaxID=136849 RepID=F3FND7_PSESX|nr:hypothetical protein PSYJA_23203 [Pseudomonas syringae pv. japonica str. M301072]KPW06562.1 hypothetical protein ALO42_102415 [Pseudomonas syringae pv. atrofaciens]KPY69289.1 hypothetical protein ALO45_101882 [Pseudomonas syringae pv. syringae]KPZ02366.1 hypothetical protein ALO85_101690 [Pseudomonas syringae pv. aptata]RMN66769.1 hypothetical protein ALQ54_101570 [Pseudomonas syringae]RMR92454.1 hypothetical protein ALP78_102085 [Pseudomonas coronafaciens pv. striafaciens]
MCERKDELQIAVRMIDLRGAKLDEGGHMRFFCKAR